MKTRLTVEQSQHLIELGVPKEKASENELYNDPSSWVKRVAPIFSLEDFLNGEILPKEIENPVFYDDLEEPEYYEKYRIALVWGSSDFEQTPPKYIAYYKKVDWVAHDTRFIEFKSEELIDALYHLACWYYGEYLKSKNEQKV